MLKSLKIENFALIDLVELNLSAGFSVVTGQTGAGKSVILNALQLVLGARADLSLIQHKEKKCVLEASFELNDSKKSLFEQNELDFWDECVLRREINAQGKSRMFINDTPVQLNVLKSIGQELLQVHSQHQTYELKGKNFSLNLVDDYGGLIGERTKYKKQFDSYKKHTAELELKKQELTANANEISFLTFQLTEFDGLDFSQNFEEIQKQFDVSENSSHILHNLESIEHLLSEGDGNVLVSLKESLNKLSEIDKFISGGDELKERLESLNFELVDICEELVSTKDKVSIDPNEQQILEDKLSQYNALLKKHFLSNQSELQKKKEEIEIKLDQLNNSEDFIKGMEEELTQLKNKCQVLAKSLSQKRLQSAQKLEVEIVSELKGLSMDSSKIKIAFEQKELAVTGYDQIQCMIAVNEGMALAPIEKSISGGEMSRFMLAVQNLLSTKKDLPTMIFDEIDTGVSGLVAEQMANKMLEMSSSIQVVAITHLPQVASKGNFHFKVVKEMKNESTKSNVVTLSSDERIVELASLLSGSKVTEEALKHAKGLLKG